MLLIGPEIAMNVLGTMWAFTDYIQCDDEEFTSTAIESKPTLMLIHTNVIEIKSPHINHTSTYM